METQTVISAEQRILIAKDVLSNLKSRRIIAKNCVYVKLNNHDFNLIADASGECQLNDLLKDKKCQVCAIGGLFICALDRFNVLKREDIDPIEYNDELADLGNILSYLEDYFSHEQLGLIEKTFEVDEDNELSLSYNNLLSEKMRKSAIKFGKFYKNSTKRLAAIMRNIIRHKGEFKPELASLR